MSKISEEINTELGKIKSKIEKGNQLTPEDLKIILLCELNEEDLHESKQ